MHFTELVDLASERLGSAVLAANDEFFAPKENLLKAAAPIFRDGEYTDRGKWMDGWETRRRRSPGFDWCLIRLGVAGIVRGVLVDTAYFRGNYPEHCSLEGCMVDPLTDVAQLKDENAKWTPIVPTVDLQPDAQNLFEVDNDQPLSHLRFNIYPDGGVARLRVYGEVVPDWELLRRTAEELDLVAVENGGLVLFSSDMFFGHRHNLIMPGRAANMSDGWETKRRRGPGHDWVIIKLGTTGQIRRVEVDTSYFKGNFPESCSLEAYNLRDLPPERLTDPSVSWKSVLPRTRLQADTRHLFTEEVLAAGAVSHVKFNIFPDGGVSRLRVYGTIANNPVADDRQTKSGLAHLNSLSRDEARGELLACCGSRRWANEMVSRRPYSTRENLEANAKAIWWSLDSTDWMEAFRSHPAIGEQKAEATASEAARIWSEQEQSGMHNTDTEMQQTLKELNSLYHKKFGYIFIVSATGKSSEELLANLRGRLNNDPAAELRVAATEQAKITALRLQKLLNQ